MVTSIISDNEIYNTISFPKEVDLNLLKNRKIQADHNFGSFNYFGLEGTIKGFEDSDNLHMSLYAPVEWFEKMPELPAAFKADIGPYESKYDPGNMVYKLPETRIRLEAFKEAPIVDQKGFQDFIFKIALERVNEFTPGISAAIEKNVNENKLFDGMEYTKKELKSIIQNEIIDRLKDYDIDINLISLELYGSRNRGTSGETSDLDIALEYEGDIREDDLFNILNENPMVIDGIRVDINPITAEKTGTMDQFISRSQEYDNEIMQKKNNDIVENFKNAGTWYLDKDAFNQLQNGIIPSGYIGDVQYGNHYYYIEGDDEFPGKLLISEIIPIGEKGYIEQIERDKFEFPISDGSVFPELRREFCDSSLCLFNDPGISVDEFQGKIVENLLKSEFIFADKLAEYQYFKESKQDYFSQYAAAVKDTVQELAKKPKLNPREIGNIIGYYNKHTEINNLVSSSTLHEAWSNVISEMVQDGFSESRINTISGAIKGFPPEIRHSTGKIIKDAAASKERISKPQMFK